MTKIDKKIIDNIELLSKTMIKNNLSEIEISDGDFSYKLKTLKIIIFIKLMRYLKKIQKKNEPSLLEKALKSPLVGTAYLSPEPGLKNLLKLDRTSRLVRFF